MTPWNLTDTYSLIKVVEQFKLPTTFLQDVFFQQEVVTMQDVISVEFIKKHRRLAPYIERGSRGLNMSREKSTVKDWRCPLIGARRTISLADISRRIVGELPVISTMTPEERALRMQTDDLKDLMNMLINRREEMAAELLTTGAIEVRGFADDGQVVDIQTITFDADWLTSVQTPWNNTSATIYDDLKAAVEYIAEETGSLPDIAICGRNVEGYLLKNAQLKEWYAVQNRANLTMMTFAPKYQSPNARYIGSINALGLELYNYLGTYFDDATGTVKRYIPDDVVIVGTSGAGRMVYGRVDLAKDGVWSSYSGANVPFYSHNNDNQTTSLTLYSRSLPIMETIDSVRALKVKE